MPALGETVALIENDGQGAGTLSASQGWLGGTLNIIEGGNSLIRRTRVYFGGSVNMVADAGSLTRGTVALYDFPRGNICVLGGAGTLTVGTLTTGILATGTVSAAVGTGAVGAGSTTLGGTTKNFITDSTLILTAGTKAGQLLSTQAPAALDGTTTGTAKTAYLNLITQIAASSPGPGGTLSVSGYADLAWCKMGDS